MVELTPTQMGISIADSLTGYIAHIPGSVSCRHCELAQDIADAFRTVEQATVDAADEWLEHNRECIRSYQSAGEPIPGGGYRQKFKGMWYQASPVDETPKCDCGLDEFRRLVGVLRKPRKGTP